MKIRWRGVALGSLLLTAQGAQAETAYIVDQLLVGLHQEKDINSPISKVLATGTQVEILRREGDYAEIREPEEGKTGWVDSSYLMLDVPAKVRLAAVEEELNRLKSQDSVQTSQAEQQERDQAHVQEVSELNTQLDELKQSLSSEKLKVGELEATISTQEKSLAQIEASTDPDRLALLQKENADLKAQLAETTGAAVAEPGSLQAMIKEPLALIQNRTVQITLGVLAVIMFLLGRRFEDHKTRKRHGGFRI